MRSLRLLAVAVLAVAAAQEEEEEGDFKSENARRRDEAAKYTYCEEDNCYDLLGVKQTSLAFAIKRAYRRLAAEWHPDKNPDPMAREKFQKFANAYSVLADTEMRANYDYLLEHPMEFPMHFMRFGSGQYAPKTDPRIALALCVLLVSAMQYVYRHQTRANLLASAKQSREYQARLRLLMEQMAEAEKKGADKKGVSGKARQTSGSSKSSRKGGAAAELRAAAEAQLELELESELGEPPSWKNTLVFSLVPMMREFYAVITKEPETLTRRALGLSAYQWGLIDAEEREELLGKELWESDNLEAYNEEMGIGGDAGAAQKPKKPSKAKQRKAALRGGAAEAMD